MKDLIYIAIILALAGLVSSLYHINKESEGCIRSYSDSIAYLQNEYGELAIKSAQDKISNDSLGQVLKEQVASLEKSLKSQASTIVHTKSQIHYDTIYTVIEDIQSDSNFSYFSFGYGDDFLSLNGNVVASSDSSSVTLNNLKLDIPITAIETTDNQLVLQSDCPYFTARSIEYVRQQRKQSRYRFFAGVSFGPQYGFINKKFDIGIQAGLGFAYIF